MGEPIESSPSVFVAPKVGQYDITIDAPECVCDAIVHEGVQHIDVDDVLLRGDSQGIFEISVNLIALL